MAVVLVLGFSNIFADALSMGVGEYLSSKVRPYVPRPVLQFRHWPTFCSVNAAAHISAAGIAVLIWLKGLTCPRRYAPTAVEYN